MKTDQIYAKEVHEGPALQFFNKAMILYISDKHNKYLSYIYIGYYINSSGGNVFDSLIGGLTLNAATLNSADANFVNHLKSGNNGLAVLIITVPGQNAAADQDTLDVGDQLDTQQRAFMCEKDPKFI